MKLKDKNLYYVGGFVRDEILTIKNFDVDYCYVGNAIEFAQKYNIIKSNKELGTVRISIDDEEIDIASTRTEYYSKAGHLPIIKTIACSLEEDLKRRDFTINALAKNTVTNEIIDFFHGLDDIKEKKIKVLHNKSFEEDPTRIVRALKFSVRLNFELDNETRLLQQKYLENINYDMSYFRLLKELKETFNLNLEIALTRFIEEGIYKLLGKNQKTPLITTSIQNLVNQYQPKNIWLVYLGLFDLSNFDLNSEEKLIIEKFNKIKQIMPKTDYEIYKLFKNLPIETILLYAISVNFKIAKFYLDKLSIIKINITGDDLLKLGIPQGKIYKEIFEFVEQKKIENPNITKEEELKLINQLFK